MTKGCLIDEVGERLLLKGDIHIPKGAPVRFPDILGQIGKGGSRVQ